MPENAVYVGRPTQWGNPFKVGGRYKIGTGAWIWVQSYRPHDPGFTLLTTTEECVLWYRRMLTQFPKLFGKKISALEGKDLACWCPLDKMCHADVLLELANK